MYKNIWICLFVSVYGLAIAQERQGTATYLMDENAFLKSLLKIYKNVDEEKTLQKPNMRETKIYFDEKTRQTRLQRADMEVQVYKKDGEVIELPIKSNGFIYRFLNAGERYNYQISRDGSKCLSQGKTLEKIKIYYTQTDTTIGSYNCQKAYYQLPNGDSVFIYTAAELPTALNPFLYRFDELKGGVVYQKHPTEGTSILKSVHYQALEPEKTQLPKGVAISEEPCRSPK